MIGFRHSIRFGASLIELLVVVGITGILMSLLLPAVQTAREAARRAQCAHRLRQIGLAIGQYTDVHGCLPPGRVVTKDPAFAGPDPKCTAQSVGHSIFVELLPYFDNPALYDSINHDRSIQNVANTTAWRFRVGTLVCPSDPWNASPINGKGTSVEITPQTFGLPVTMTNYAGAYGSLWTRSFPLPGALCLQRGRVLQQTNGVFNDVMPMKLRNVKDGLSQTLFASEVVSAGANPVDNFGYHHRWWCVGDLDSTLFANTWPPNEYRRLPPIARSNAAIGASSYHPGGLHCLFGDSSVRFIGDQIDSWKIDDFTGVPLGASYNPLGWWDVVPKGGGIWQALATRDGDEAVSF